MELDKTKKFLYNKESGETTYSREKYLPIIHLTKG
jgi:hypothetical protein